MASARSCGGSATCLSASAEPRSAIAASHLVLHLHLGEPLEDVGEPQLLPAAHAHAEYATARDLEALEGDLQVVAILLLAVALLADVLRLGRRRARARLRRRAAAAAAAAALVLLLEAGAERVGLRLHLAQQRRRVLGVRVRRGQRALALRLHHQLERLRARTTAPRSGRREERLRRRRLLDGLVRRLVGRPSSVGGAAGWKAPSRRQLGRVSAQIEAGRMPRLPVARKMEVGGGCDAPRLAPRLAHRLGDAPRCAAPSSTARRRR